MASMSYCRFYNALNDLQHAYEHMDDDLQEPENSYRLKLIALCAQIAANYDDEASD